MILGMDVAGYASGERAIRCASKPLKIPPGKTQFSRHERARSKRCKTKRYDGEGDPKNIGKVLKHGGVGYGREGSVCKGAKLGL